MEVWMGSLIAVMAVSFVALLIYKIYKNMEDEIPFQVQ